MSSLTREQIVDLLYYLGASKVINRETKKDIMFTCTVHGENNPSAGYDVEKEVFHCFSCHESGGIEWWVMKSNPTEFKSIYDVDKFIKDRYNVDLNRKGIKTVELPRYGVKKKIKVKESKKTLPKSFLAPYKCGKETYKYFYDRGFTKETLIDFKIGRDLENKTVVVPIYNDKEELQGMIGRYIDPNRRSNERYKIYEVSTGEVLYPMHRTKPKDGVIILVEGLLDALYMHQLGYTNTCAILTNFLSKNQAKWILKNADKVIDLTDNDDMGEIASKSIKDKLRRNVRVINGKCYYPKGKKDPQDCTKNEIDKIINSALSYRKSMDKFRIK